VLHFIGNAFLPVKQTLIDKCNAVFCVNARSDTNDDSKLVMCGNVYSQPSADCRKKIKSENEIIMSVKH